MRNISEKLFFFQPSEMSVEYPNQQLYINYITIIFSEGILSPRAPTASNLDFPTRKGVVCMEKRTHRQACSWPGGIQDSIIRVAYLKMGSPRLPRSSSFCQRSPEPKSWVCVWENADSSWWKATGCLLIEIDTIIIKLFMYSGLISIRTPRRHARNSN